MKWLFIKCKCEIKNFVINSLYRLKYRPIKVIRRNTYYCIFERNKKHAGVADRLKTVIIQYDLAKANGYKFKLYWKTPFDLAQYFKPKNEWQAELNDLEYSLFDTKIISEMLTWRKMKNLVPNKQYHCYRYAGGLLPQTMPYTGSKWHDLFWELFEPSEELKDAYHSLAIPEKSYISIHIRFVNALERFENTYFDNYLETQEERDALILRCKRSIQEIQKTYFNKEVFVFSDSKLFLDSLDNLSVKTLNHENICHVSENSNSESQLKTFLDLYFMSKSICVYRFQAPELLSMSGFSMVAANIGDIPFYNVKI